MKRKLTFLIVVSSVILGGIILTFTKTGSSNKTRNNSGVKAKQSQSITVKELTKHNNKNDCWMAIDEKVYDITDFIPSHPGGSQILKGCGINATELFNTHGTPGGRAHSALAKRLLQKYEIGQLN